MTSPLIPEARRRVISIIHAALMTGLIAFVLVTAWLQRARPPAPVAPGFARALIYAGLGVLAVVLLVLRILPRPDPAPAPEQSVEQWLQLSQARLIVRWAPVEGASLLNAVAWLITGERTPLAAAVAGIAVLFALRPARYLD